MSSGMEGVSAGVLITIVVLVVVAVHFVCAEVMESFAFHLCIRSRERKGGRAQMSFIAWKVRNILVETLKIEL